MIQKQQRYEALEGTYVTINGRMIDNPQTYNEEVEKVQKYMEKYWKCKFIVFILHFCHVKDTIMSEGKLQSN